MNAASYRVVDPRVAAAGPVPSPNVSLPEGSSLTSADEPPMDWSVGTVSERDNGPMPVQDHSASGSEGGLADLNNLRENIAAAATKIVLESTYITTTNTIF